MRALVVIVSIMSVLAGAAAAAAGDVVRRRHAFRTDLFLDLPLEYSTDVVFPFGGSHHAVPGVVSINGAPYRCLVHERRFRARTHFVAHLRTGHGLTDDAIPSRVILDRGEVVYLGE